MSKPIEAQLVIYGNFRCSNCNEILIDLDNWIITEEDIKEAQYRFEIHSCQE